jgi:hypothetical protein
MERTTIKKSGKKGPAIRDEGIKMIKIKRNLSIPLKV